MEHWDHDIKNQVRTQVCQGGPYKNVLLLPSESCLDVIEMLNNNSIDKETRIVAIERDYYTAETIKEKLKELNFTSFTVLNTELHLAELDGQFDYVYLDTCGQLTASIINWLSTQVQEKRFAKDCKIVLAFSMYMRGSFEFIQSWEKYLIKAKKPKAVVNPSQLGTDSAVQVKQHRLMATLLRDILGEVESSIIYKNEGNHPTMHVFEFKTRQQNLGLINIIKFLKLHTKEEPKLLTPGLKAAATRFNLEKLKSGSAKAKENKSLLLKLQDRIEALEKLITQQVPTKPKYNGLTVLENITEKKVLCRCECGKAVHAYLKQVQDGAVKTCGKVSCKNKYKNSRSILRAST